MSNKRKRTNTNTTTLLEPNAISEVSLEEMEIENMLFGSSLPSEGTVTKKRKIDQDGDNPLTETGSPLSAWTDEDEDQTIINVANKKRLRKLRDNPNERRVHGDLFQQKLRDHHSVMTNHMDSSWADHYEDENDEYVNDVNQSVESVLRKGKNMKWIKSGKINLTRVTDLTKNNKINAVVNELAFHPSGRLVLTGSFDKRIRIFKLESRKSEVIQTVFFPNMPIMSAKFSNDGNEVIACGPRNFFHSVDLETAEVSKIDIHGSRDSKLKKCWYSPDGQYILFLGDKNIVVLSQRSKLWVANLVMNTRPACGVFSPDSRYFYSSGEGGEVYTWDMSTFRCINRFVDQGSTYTTAIDLSKNGNLLSTGSQDGVVNLYNMSDLTESSNPLPAKEFMNLTNSIDNIAFNHDGQLLSFSSMKKNSAYRLANTLSQTVYQNFPDLKTDLSRVSSHIFSSDSKRMLIANAKGSVLLYNVNHYM